MCLACSCCDIKKLEVRILTFQATWILCRARFDFHKKNKILLPPCQKVFVLSFCCITLLFTEVLENPEVNPCERKRLDSVAVVLAPSPDQLLCLRKIARIYVTVNPGHRRSPKFLINCQGRAQTYTYTFVA